MQPRSCGKPDSYGHGLARGLVNCLHIGGNSYAQKRGPSWADGGRSDHRCILDVNPSPPGGLGLDKGRKA